MNSGCAPSFHFFGSSCRLHFTPSVCANYRDHYGSNVEARDGWLGQAGPTTSTSAVIRSRLRCCLAEQRKNSGEARWHMKVAYAGAPCGRLFAPLNNWKKRLRGTGPFADSRESSVKNKKSCSPLAPKYRTINRPPISMHDSPLAAGLSFRQSGANNAQTVTFTNQVRFKVEIKVERFCTCTSSFRA